MGDNQDNKKNMDSDASLFADAMKDVRPLAQSNRAQLETKKSRVRFDHPIEEFPDRLTDPPTDIPVGAEEVLFYNSGGLQQSQVKKLKRGQITIEDRLDLHGMTKDEANLVLNRFILESQSHDLRCVNVVHGKGYRSSENLGVLKSAVNYWLRQHPAVVAFASATPQDGGTGAVNILIRRKK